MAIQDKKRCAAIVLAAGQGKRMGASVQKQYIELEGKPLIYYALNTFQKSEIIDTILLVVFGIRYLPLSDDKQYRINDF